MEIGFSLDSMLDIISLKIILLSFLDDHAGIHFDVPVERGLEGGLSGLRFEIVLGEDIVGVLEVLLGVVIIVGLVEEESVPSFVPEEADEGGHFDGVVAGDDAGADGGRELAAVVVVHPVVPHPLLQNALTVQPLLGLLLKPVRSHEPSERPLDPVHPRSSLAPTLPRGRVARLAVHHLE